MEVKVVILKEGPDGGGNYITGEACKAMVERFNSAGKQLPITLEKMPITVGKVIRLELCGDKEKEVIAYINLNMDFVTGGRVLQDIETPEGKRILDSELKIVNLILLGGKV